MERWYVNPVDSVGASFIVTAIGSGGDSATTTFTDTGGQGIDFTSVVNNSTNGSWSLGWRFQANQTVPVTQLGFYDDFKNGLTQSHDVGLYTSSGSLLASTTVTNADPLIGFFRYHPISPVSLIAGQVYVVTAITGSENYTWNPNGLSVDSRISFLSDEFIASTTLAFPRFSSSVVGWFGANLLFAMPPTISSLSPSTIPEGNGTFTLTINGTNFAPNASVQWNSTSLTVTSNTPTAIQVTVTAQ